MFQKLFGCQEGSEQLDAGQAINFSPRRDLLECLLEQMGGPGCPMRLALPHFFGDMFPRFPKTSGEQ